MSWTQDSTNTTTLTGSGTPDTLVAGATTDATYVFICDLSNEVNGDVIECAILLKTLTGSTLTRCAKASWSNAQANPVKFSMPIPSGFSVSVTMTQQLGTGRAVPWSLQRI